MKWANKHISYFYSLPAIFFVKGVKWKQFPCDYVTFSSPSGWGTTQFSWFHFSDYENSKVKRHGYGFHPPALAAKGRDSVTMGSEMTRRYDRQSEIARYCTSETTARLRFTLYTLVTTLSKLLLMCSVWTSTSGGKKSLLMNY